MAALFCSVFFSMAGFSVLLPSILFVLQNMGATPSIATLSLAAYSFLAFLVGPLLGRMSDSRGRKPVLVVSYLIAAMAYGAMSQIGTSVISVIACMALTGAMSGNIAVVYAAVADRSGISDRTRAMGLMGAAIGCAFVLGPGVGGYVGGETGDAATLALPASVSALSLLIAGLVTIAFLPPDTRIDDVAAEPKAPRGLAALGALADKSLGSAIVGLSVVIGLFTLALSLMEPALPIYVSRLHDWGPKEVGRLFLLVGLVLVLVQGAVVGRLVRRIGEVPTALIGMTSMGLGLFMLAVAVPTGVMGYAVGLAALGSGLTTASVAALLSKQVSASKRGAAMGGFQSAQALARSIGPVAAGLLLEVQTTLPLWAGAAIVLLSGIAFLAVSRTISARSAVAQPGE